MSITFPSRPYTNIFLFVLFYFAGITLHAQDLYINEFMASNSSTIADENGEFDDWVEIFNDGATAIDIAGMYLTDDTTNTTKWQIPATNAALTTIPAGGFILLWFDNETEQGELHIGAKLGAGGEDIGWYASDGTTLIDAYTFGPQLEDISEGRVPDAGADWDFYPEPTPGATNDTDPGIEKSDIPVADMPGGLYTGSITVTLTSATADAEIFYTLDATDPSDNSIEYTGPITISTITPLRAIAYSPTLLPSDVMTETYLIGVDHDFAIVTINTDTVNLYDDDLGIFTNFEEDIEAPAHIQFYEPDGTLGFSQDIEIEVFGNASASLPQKSLKIKAKSSLGNEFFEYEIFPDQSIDEYRSFVMRQSGQDWNVTMFRDALEQGLMDDIADLNGVLEKPDLDLQGYRPGVVYLNGEYWGIYNVREQMNWKYLNAHYGIEQDEVDISEDEDEVEKGDLGEWIAFNEFLENTSFSSDANYQTLRERADVDHFIDYMLHGMILDNNDWPGNNNKHYREKTADAKWRWLTKDLDFGFGLRPLNAGWNSGDFTTNMLEVCLAENSSNYYNPPESTLFLRRLMENDGAKTYFINRAADFLNTVFEPARVIARIDSMETIYIPEMQAHYDRWQSGYNDHDEEVEVLRIFANGRAPEVRTHFANYYPEISGITDITIDANPSNGGNISFSTLNFTETNFPWEGAYFQNMDIPVSAKPARGFVLDSWSDASLGNDLETITNINSSSYELTANFIPGSNATDPIVINEINYNSPNFPDPEDWIELYNPNTTAVDISGWYFEDESGDYFGLPANTVLAPGAYLMLAEDLESFMNVYPNATNVVASFGKDPGGFGLSGGGELMTIKNANGVLIDEVEYDDNAPWPDEPDGDGPTLQLTDPALDNSIASSWESFEPTPGALNGVVPIPQDQSIDFPEIEGQFTFAPPIELEAMATSGLPVSYSMVSGPATISGSTLTLDGVIGTVIVRASQAGNANYYAALDVDQNFYVMEFTGAPDGYCESEGNAPWQEWISNVAFNAIDHPSNKTQYSDFTNIGTYVTQNASYNMILTPEFSGTIFEEFWSVWIDYNQDGDFEDAGEEVFSVSSSNNNPLTGNIAIPADAELGATRMRIAMKRDAFADPCEFFAKGEVEDYTVIIDEAADVLTFSCPDDINTTVPGGSTGALITWTEPMLSTTCPLGGESATQTTGPMNGALFPVGETIVTYTATDDCGNLETCSFKVTITEDFGTLDITCPADIDLTVSGGATGAIANWSEPIPTTTCAAGGETANQTGGPPNGTEFPIGATVVTYTATDDCGNLETCTFTVTVALNNGTLSITCPAAITEVIPPGSTGTLISWMEPIPATTCPLGGEVASQTAGLPNGSTFPVGTTVINYEATDDCGNLETCSFSVTIELGGNELTIECPDDVIVNTLPGAPTAVAIWDDATAITNCSLGGLEVGQSSGDPSGSAFPIGSSLIAYKAKDACDNSATCTFNVVVNATPVDITIDCPANISVLADTGGTGATVSWATPTGSTDCYLNGLAVTQTAGDPSGSFFLVGTHTISYQAMDACSAMANCSFEITVTSTTGTISLECPDNINVVLPLGQTSTTINWPSPLASTTCNGGSLNPNCGTTITGFTSLGTLGGHEYFYSNSGKPWTAAQADCELYAGYLVAIGDAAEDAFIGANVSEVIHIGLNDADTEGALEWTNGEVVTYTNYSSSFQNNDGIDYGYKSPWNGKWKLYSGNAWKSYVMEMDCAAGSSVVLEQTGGPLNGSALPAGVYTVTYEATDDCGDLQICSFTITIEANPQSLVIECPDNITVTEESGTGGAVVSWSAATATSVNCPGAITVTQTGGDPSGSIFPIGTHVITYSATDACANVETCSFIITVEADAPATDDCESQGDAPWQQWVSNVSFNEIDNNSGKNGYGDFTGISTNVVTDGSYTISVTPKFSWTHWDEYVRVWIDYNGDLDFDDAGEKVFEAIYMAGASGTDAPPLAGPVTIPTDAPAGVARMRVAMKKDAFAEPCETFALGEVEDYTVKVNFNGSNLEGTTETFFFNAMKNGRKVALNWITDTEYKNDYFMVEHSLDGSSFETLMEIDSREDVESQRLYSEADLRPALGVNYYRLKQVYKDGSFRQSATKKIVFDFDLEGFALFPNPATDQVFVNLDKYKGMEANIQIFNALGQRVLQEQMNDIPEHAVCFDVSKFHNGIYTISIKVGELKRLTKQFVISRLY